MCTNVRSECFSFKPPLPGQLSRRTLHLLPNLCHNHSRMHSWRAMLQGNTKKGSSTRDNMVGLIWSGISSSTSRSRVSSTRSLFGTSLHKGRSNRDVQQSAFSRESSRSPRPRRQISSILLTTPQTRYASSTTYFQPVGLQS
jgi:hypothetical protein